MCKMPFYRFLFFFLVLSNTSFGQLPKSHEGEINDISTALRKSDSLDIAHGITQADLLDRIATLPEEQAAQKTVLEKRLKQLQIQDSVRRVELQQRIDQARMIYKGYPVVAFQDTLFMVYHASSPITAEERAGFIAANIREAASDDGVSLDKIRSKKSGTSVELLAGESQVMVINNADAIWNGQSKEVLAKVYLDKIRTDIAKQRDAKSNTTLLKHIGEFLLLLVVLYLFVKFINKGTTKIKDKINRYKSEHANETGWKRFLNDERGLSVLIRGVNGLKILLIVLVFYFASPILFGLLPWTKNWSVKLVHWTLDPLKRIVFSVVDYLPNLLTIIVIAVVVHYFSRLLKFIADEVEKGSIVIPGFYADWAQTTYNIVRFLLYAFMFVIIFPYLPGSDSPIFKGVSVFLGLLFSIGSSSAIANVVSGLVITYMRPFKEGDFVKIGEVVGVVLEKNLLVTRVKTIKNEQITVPNSSILSGHTINYSAANVKSAELILHTGVTIGYDAPWRQIHELLISAALATNGIVKDKKPFVLQTSLDDFYVSYEINAYTDKPLSMAVVYSELHQNIQDKFFEAGVEIMSPHYSTLRDGNPAAIPADYLPKDYKVPSFRVEKTDDNKSV